MPQISLERVESSTPHPGKRKHYIFLLAQGNEQRRVCHNATMKLLYCLTMITFFFKGDSLMTVCKYRTGDRAITVN